MALCVACGSCGSSGERVPLLGIGADGGTGASALPARRGGAPAAWMPDAAEMVIFGGSDAFNDTWGYDLQNRTWTRTPSD